MLCLVSMEQKSGLIGLSSLMNRLDDKVNTNVVIYPSSLYYKGLHISPKFIKAEQPQLIKVRTKLILFLDNL